MRKSRRRVTPPSRLGLTASSMVTTCHAVLVGASTCSSKWVTYEIEQSKARGNGLFGVDVSQINDFEKKTTTCCGEIPKGYPFYRWFGDKGYDNLGDWVEKAAKAAGK